MEPASIRLEPVSVRGGSLFRMYCFRLRCSPCPGGWWRSWVSFGARVVAVLGGLVWFLMLVLGGAGGRS